MSESDLLHLELYEAARDGKKELVESLLQRPGVDVNATTLVCTPPFGITGHENPLYGAAKNGHVEIVQLLLQQPGINVNEENMSDQTALEVAARNGHEEVVALLLEQPYINLRFSLVCATLSGKLSLVKFLLKQPGIDVNAKTSWGETALYRATEHGNREIVELLLLQPGIDVNIQNVIGESTALRVAASKGFEEIVTVLLKIHGIDVNAKDKDGRTALFAAARHGHDGIVELLLQQPTIDVSLGLIGAATSGKMSLLERMLRLEGVNVNSKDSQDGSTALHIAASNGQRDMLQLLLQQNGINMNAKNDNDETPLYLAATTGHHDIVTLLLEQSGIDINARTDQGETALCGATRTGLVHIVEELLQQQGIDTRWSVIGAASDGSVELLPLLLERQVTLSSIERKLENSIALFISASNGYEDVVQVLLQQEGSDLKFGMIGAVVGEKEDIVQSILEQQHVVFTVDGPEEMTAYYAAVAGGLDDIEELLRTRVGLIKAKNRIEECALFLTPSGLYKAFLIQIFDTLRRIADE